jgi:anti-sigma B factor antagonist
VRPELTVVPGGHVVVALSGEIDIVTAPVTRDLLAEAASEAVTGITVDLGEVTFLDAAGLGVLAGASGAARRLPGGFRLVAVPARVLRLLTLTGLDCHLAAFPAPPGSQAQRECAAALVAATGPLAGARSTVTNGDDSRDEPAARAVVERGPPV